MTTAFINQIATRVPPHDVHGLFVGFARALLGESRQRAVFDRMAARSRIDHRYSVLALSERGGGRVEAGQFYATGRFPSTAARMEVFEAHAPALARDTVRALELGAGIAQVTHLIVTSCTGMYAPGIDLELISLCGLDPRVERTMVGFMGCSAAINALKLARHIVRSAPESRVLLVNLELCSLHLHETQNLEQILSFLVFGDGCAASLVSAEPRGLALDRFHAAVLPDTADLITWKVRDSGFDMRLSGRVPEAIGRGLEAAARDILDGATPDAIQQWAVHPGGRSVLDAVDDGLGLEKHALAGSRDILARFGNMSSATVMFVLEGVLRTALSGERGCAMAFGPGLTAETMLFHKASS